MKQEGEKDRYEVREVEAAEVANVCANRQLEEGEKPIPDQRIDPTDEQKPNPLVVE